jgi:DNA polymerase III delta prime subunit
MTDNSGTIWTEKYRPKSLVEYFISKSQLELVKTWMLEIKLNDPDAKPFLVLYGTPGIGKTTLATLILQQYGYEIIECNASDSRSKKNIRETLGSIAKTSVCVDEKNKFKPTAIILDEIDGLMGGETGAVQEIVNIVTKDKDSKNDVMVCPVICTTNSIKEKKLQPLLKHSVLLNLGKPSDADCLKLINKICKAEQFKVNDAEKRDIIKKAYSDYRQIIMLLFGHYHKIKGNEIEDANKTEYNDDVDDEDNILTNVSNSVSAIDNVFIKYCEKENEHYDLIKKIEHIGDSPLDKINYFLVNNVNLDDIRYICSGDSNLYYMNFYTNIILIISAIQIKNGKVKTKEDLLFYYNLLSKIYNYVRDADLMNNSIFFVKNWDLIEYFDCLGIAIPLKILNDKNKMDNIVVSQNTISKLKKSKIENVDKYYVGEFPLSHHTLYNFMRQEQSLYKKKINIDYMKTHESDIVNIYYNLKRFQNNNKDTIELINSKYKKKKPVNNDDCKYLIDKQYIKLLDKIDELLK